MNLLYEKKLSSGYFRSYDAKPEFEMAHVHQVHSALVVSVKTPNLSEVKADGIFSSSDTTLAIKTADCMPIAVIGEKGTALLHAGWRGLADGILFTDEIRELSPREFFIGPCIHSCCFEVTSEFKAHFPHSPIITKDDGSLRFDLVLEAQRQILAHFPEAQVTESSECTCCTMKYPSFRRNKTSQRIWNLFIPLAK